MSPYIGFEGDYVELEDTVRDAMLFTIGGLTAGETHLELGSGSGHFVTAGRAVGANSFGWEISAARYATSESQAYIDNGDILTNDLKANDIRNADLITFWFTDNSQGFLFDLFVKLYRNMSAGARLVCLMNSRREYKDGVEQQIDRNWNIDNEFWVPELTWVEGNLVHRFVR